MRFHVYNPPPGNQYCTEMFLGPLRSYAAARAVEIAEGNDITQARGIVLTLSDNLTPENISILKNNGCKIIGFNVTDSCYVSQACRSGEVLKNIDLMFMVSGVQKVNIGDDIAVDESFSVHLVPKRFLPAEDWDVFNAMRLQGRLQSLPYVHWHRQPHVDPMPYSQRSKKVITRGGGHSRRFILALNLMRLGKLDSNSAFMLSAYFDPNMNPQFRYCGECQRKFKGYYHYEPPLTRGECNSPAPWGGDSLGLSDLSPWNNRCPKSFFWLAERFNALRGGINMREIERMCNGRWLSADDHLRILARMLYTTDLKWIFSIYAPQRFWDAAMVGCINFLPRCTVDQDYFPPMYENVHYKTYREDMSSLSADMEISEKEFNDIGQATKRLYDDYMRPTGYPINTNLLAHIFRQIEIVA